MSHKVVYYLPLPKHTITRYVIYSLTPRRARTLAARQYRRYRKYGPVSILDDSGGVVATDGAIRLLVEAEES